MTLGFVADQELKCASCGAAVGLTFTMELDFPPFTPRVDKYRILKDACVVDDLLSAYCNADCKQKTVV